MPPMPPFTKALMLVCVGVYFLDLLLDQSLSQGPWLALWPIGSGNFFPWQLVTYGFLHGGMAHLIFNMLGLWMFGGELERLWGPRRYWHLLLASLLTAGATQLAVTYLLGSRVPTVGASGALYGLLLAYAVVFPRRQFDLVGFLPMVLLMIPGQIFYTLGIILFMVLFLNRQMVPLPPIPIPAPTMVLIFGAIELLMGIFYSRSGIAHFAHLGGMLGAWLLLLHWRGRLPFGRRR
jgi:membrane associated rhomboid family serine protease